MTGNSNKTPDINGLITHLKNEYPDLVVLREKKNITTFRKTQSIGITIIQRKNKVLVDVFFPTFQAKALFYNCNLFRWYYYSVYNILIHLSQTIPENKKRS